MGGAVTKDFQLLLKIGRLLSCTVAINNLHSVSK
jgi:hypothetical protein